VAAVPGWRLGAMLGHTRGAVAGIPGLVGTVST
jgi:hypothetical protein